MKSLEFVLNNFKSQCLDRRDTYRLGNYVPEDKLYLLKLTLNKDVQYTLKEWCRENILDDLNKDIKFGYQKALDGRGISTDLMTSVVEMWDWILTDDIKPLGAKEKPVYLLQSSLNKFKNLAKKYNINLEEK